MAFLFQLDKRLLGIGLRLVLGTAPLKIIQLGIQIFLVAHLIYDVDFGVDPFIFTEKALGQLPLITCNLASQSQTLAQGEIFLCLDLCILRQALKVEGFHLQAKRLTGIIEPGHHIPGLDWVKLFWIQARD